MTLVMSEMHLAAFIPGSCSAFAKWGKLFPFIFLQPLLWKALRSIMFLTTEWFKWEISGWGDAEQQGISGQNAPE